MRHFRRDDWLPRMVRCQPFLKPIRAEGSCDFSIPAAWARPNWTMVKDYFVWLPTFRAVWSVFPSPI